MLQITCPWCGPRAESEFTCGGEAHIARPLDTDALSDEQWGDYLFMRKNPKGLHREQWLHASGCRRWFNAERHTVSYTFTQFYKPGEAPVDTMMVSAVMGSPSSVCNTNGRCDASIEVIKVSLNLAPKRMACFSMLSDNS